jgi:hypothetical protein
MATTGSYYIDRATGTIQQQTNPLLAAGLRAAGFIGPYATVADAKAAIGGKDYGGDVASAAKDAESDLNPLNDIASITGISGTNLVIRSLKVIIGATLLLVGIVHLADINAGTITTLARKVPV